MSVSIALSVKKNKCPHSITKKDNKYEIGGRSGSREYGKIKCRAHGAVTEKFLKK